MLLLALAPRAAAQDALNVALVDPDGSLGGAMETALGPWGIAVRVVDEGSPGATMPGSEARGRALARRHDADASVWVSESEDGFAVWVYDARQDRVIARALPSGPPFDELTAAEVALTVKALLRQGPVSPPPEPPPAPAAADVVAAEPPAREWSLMMSAGARFGATSPDRAEARFALWLTFWPAALGRYLGFAVVAAAGPGVGVETPELTAHWTETELLFALRGRLPLGDRVDLGLTVGGGAHLTTLEGTLRRSGAGASALRVDPVLAADLALGLRVDDRLRLELRGGSSFPLRRQTYRVGEAVGLVVEPAHGRILLSAEITFF